MLFKNCFVVISVLSLFLFGTNAQLNSRCVTPNQENAICTSIYECPKLMNAIYSRDQTQLTFLRASQCGYNNGPLVCCGSRSSYAQNNNNNNNGLEGRRVFGTGGSSRPTTVSRNNLLPDRTSCGHDFSDKIFGGTETAINEFPWMALLQYSNRTGYRRYACAGTLINNRYVLTAAHCVTGDILRKVGRLVDVRLGEYDTENSRDCLDGMCNSPQDIGVEQTIYHEGYDTNNVHRYNDLALVRLNRNVQYTTFIQPICLPLPNERANVGDRVTVAGWGKTEYSSRSNIKLKVDIPIAQRQHCTRAFASAGINLRDSQICAGGQRGKDSCTGDSGGPLMKTVEGDSSTWYLEGVVSFGAKCGTEGWPGIYTKVENFLDWIHRNVRQ